MENHQGTVIQLPLKTGVPSSMPEPETTVPTPHPAPLEILLTHQEDPPVVTPHDDPPQLEFETNRLNFHPVNVPAQQPSSPACDNGDHETQEENDSGTHATRYNLRENPKPRSTKTTSC